MEDLIFSNSKFTTVSLMLCAVLAAIGTMLLVRTAVDGSFVMLRKVKDFRYRGPAFKFAEQFELELEAFKDQVRVLDKYTSEYTGVFNEANWSKVVFYLDDLDAAYEELCSLISRYEYKDAMCLVRFLCADGAELPEWILRHVDARWDHLFEWKSEVSEILQTVTVRLGAAAEQTKRLGIERTRQRQPTLTALQRLKEKLDPDPE
jgi:hypothetical protein